MEDDNELSVPEDAAEHPEIKFDYIKSNLFRVIHVDQVLGAVTPSGDINLHFCNERFPIPNEVVHQLNEDGTLGDENLAKRVHRGAIVREVETCAVMNTELAKGLITLLQELIAGAETEEEDANE